MWTRAPRRILKRGPTVPPTHVAANSSTLMRRRCSPPARAWKMSRRQQSPRHPPAHRVTTRWLAAARGEQRCQCQRRGLVGTHAAGAGSPSPRFVGLGGSCRADPSLSAPRPVTSTAGRAFVTACPATLSRASLGAMESRRPSREVAATPLIINNPPPPWTRAPESGYKTPSLAVSSHISEAS
jgi:hypothetical protein